MLWIAVFSDMTDFARMHVFDRRFPCYGKSKFIAVFIKVHTNSRAINFGIFFPVKLRQIF